ncbi:MAG: metallophosphoesterase [Oscillospiraceae bacterium]|nr:metallophosphoesterase [Oscillospiraceae bacterium]
MIITVFSDSHGFTDTMTSVLQRNPPEASGVFIHLGDFSRDAAVLRPFGEVFSVRGNSDEYASHDRTIPSRLLTEYEGVKILACHGHMHGVKAGLERLFSEGKEKGADVILFGHTHVPFCEVHDGVLLANPGSIACPIPGQHMSYGVLEIKDKTPSFFIKIA